MSFVKGRENSKMRKEKRERRSKRKRVRSSHFLDFSFSFWPSPINSNHERPRAPLSALCRPAPQLRHRSRRRGGADQQDR